MAQKENLQQFEIFSTDNKIIASQNRKKSFLSYIRNHEKVILLIIAFLIVNLISFSLGVEKGKKIVLKKTNQELNADLQEPVIDLTTTQLKQEDVRQAKDKEQQVPAELSLAVNKKTVEEKISKDNYTIQVATYKSERFAKKEAERLENKGLLPLILSKGDFTVLCVGKYLSKTKAEESLKELKKRYQDCFIRRL